MSQRRLATDARARNADISRPHARCTSHTIATPHTAPINHQKRVSVYTCRSQLVRSGSHATLPMRAHVGAERPLAFVRRRVEAAQLHVGAAAFICDELSTASIMSQRCYPGVSISLSCTRVADCQPPAVIHVVTRILRQGRKLVHTEVRM